MFENYRPTDRMKYYTSEEEVKKPLFFDLKQFEISIRKLANQIKKN